ncbi:MAG: toxin ParE1/3/4 [Thermomicrobiales bacterium]|nr:toxin ParE1/3/4 [Thermomicrobiales bacterium]
MHQANAYHAALRSGIEALRDNPQLGVAREVLYPGLRSHPVEVHVLYYRIQGNVIEIVRILHSRQDADAVFRVEPPP